MAVPTWKTGLLRKRVPHPSPSRFENQIEEIAEQAGHRVIFFAPSFHPELNRIEYFWGACKYYAHCRYNYTLLGLREVPPAALKSVSPELIHKYWARSQRTIHPRRSFRDAQPKGLAHASTFAAKLP